jgi:hypothetical protein
MLRGTLVVVCAAFVSISLLIGFQPKADTVRRPKPAATVDTSGSRDAYLAAVRALPLDCSRAAYDRWADDVAAHYLSWESAEHPDRPAETIVHFYETLVLIDEFRPFRNEPRQRLNAQYTFSVKGLASYEGGRDGLLPVQADMRKQLFGVPIVPAEFAHLAQVDLD